MPLDHRPVNPRPLEIVTIPCLDDNYAFLLHAADTGETALVDAPVAAPILAMLDARGWQLSEIWLTHHHWDHVDGVADLVAATNAQVIGAAADAHRLPPLDHALPPGMPHRFAGHDVQVLDVPGHTIGHIALYLPAAKALFSADSLMALGCGRLFEGGADQMWDSLSVMAALPPETMIYSGHEYTATNAAFAQTIEPGNSALLERIEAINAARADGQATVPSSLGLELATNPFLRPDSLEIRSILGMPTEPASAVFAEIRRRKDTF